MIVKEYDIQCVMKGIMKGSKEGYMVSEYKADTAGFQLACVNESFKCAWIKYGSQYSYGSVGVLKRHNESDEVFTLVCGRASLLTADTDPNKYIIRQLQIGVAYCVKAGTWHHLAVSEDALVFVVENSGVSRENTDTISVEEKNLYV